MLYTIKMKNKFKYFFIFLLFFIAGCATVPKSAQHKQKPIFFPPEPDEPRLQFLASFSSSDDFEASASAFRKFIVGEANSSKPIVKPYGLTVYNNKIYVCDTVHNAIDVLDFEKRKLEYFRPKDAGQLIDPINLCFGPNGNMYVADSRRGQVVIFSGSGDYLGAVGNKSEFKPTAVLINDNKIYICDLKTQSVKVFGLQERNYLYSIPREGAKEDAKLFSPTNMAIDEEGNLYVSDTGAFRIQKYGVTGEFLMSIGSHGDSPGQFARPKGVAVDKEGRIYAVDAAFENVQIFDKDGKLLLFFAEPGASPVSLVLPAGIAIDYSLRDYFFSFTGPSFELEYLVLVTSQYGDRKVSVFGFGHKK